MELASATPLDSYEHSNFAQPSENSSSWHLGDQTQRASAQWNSWYDISKARNTLVVPGLATNSWSVSSSTPPSQDSSRRGAEIASRKLVRSPETWWTQNCMHPQGIGFGTSCENGIQEAQYFLLTSRKIEIAKYACEPRWQRLLAEGEMAKQYLGQKKNGDLITADDRVFNERGESRNSHWYAIVVQDLASQWIQSCPCKAKTSQETERSLRKFLELSEKPQVTYTRTSTRHRSETNGIAERAVRRIKEGTSAVLLQSGTDEKWTDYMECYCYLRNVQDLLADGQHLVKEVSDKPFQGPVVPFGAMFEYHPISTRDQSRLHQFGKTVFYLEYSSDMRLDRGENLERRHYGRRHWGYGKTAEIHPRRLSMQKKCWRHKGVNFWYSQSPMEHQNCQEETTNSQNPL